MIIVLYWNCRGIANSPTIRALHHLASSNSPDVIFISKPMTITPPSNLLSSFGYDGFLSNNHQSSASIWCFFKTNTNLGISLTESFSQFLTISFLNPPNASSCLLTGVYASTNYVQRRDLWDYLSSQANTNLPWCVLGDFNSITSTSEKFSLRPSRLIPDFQNLILSFGL